MRVSIHRPALEEVPWQLLPASIASSLELDRMRIAKLGGEVVGAYVFRALGSLEYQICALVVTPNHRGRGLGRWLLGHAIGVCETKGARTITAPPTASALFRHADFQPTERGFRLLLTPD